MQIQCAVSALLSDDPSGAEQIVAVVDAREATTVQVARKQTIFKDVARTLSDVSLAFVKMLPVATLHQCAPHFLKSSPQGLGNCGLQGLQEGVLSLATLQITGNACCEVGRSEWQWHCYSNPHM